MPDNNVPVRLVIDGRFYTVSYQIGKLDLYAIEPDIKDVHCGMPILETKYVSREFIENHLHS